MPQENELHKLPDVCYSTLETTGQLICIRKGEKGYYPVSWSMADRAANRRLTDILNKKLGVTHAQELAMAHGSIFGWSIPSAGPDFWEKTNALSTKLESAETRAENNTKPVRSLTSPGRE